MEPPSSDLPDPVGPASARAADALIALYAWAEAFLLTRLTQAVQQAPAGSAGVLHVIAITRRLTRQVTARLTQEAPALADEAVQAETIAGGRAADAEVERYTHRLHGWRPHDRAAGGGSGTRVPGDTGLAIPEEPFDLTITKAQRAAQAIRADLLSSLEDVTRRITRLDDDVFKAIAPQGALALVADRAPAENATPVQAMGAAWQTFVQQGITGFVDKSGRRWGLSSYVEMAVRTAAHRAYLAADLARMHALGIHLFTIPDEDHACPLCFPWQGRVLIDDEHGYEPEPGVHVHATIAEARAAGLFHPNCRHPLIPYFPGITRVDPREWGEANQDAYRATQQLRALEVQVRKAKSAARYATEPAAGRDAARKARALQAKIRAHLAEHTDLNRRSHREQPHLRMDQTRLPGQAV